MKIKKGRKRKIVFKKKHSCFKYKVMLFALLNPPASFQNYFNKILTKKLDIFVIAYLDNILINTKYKKQDYVNFVCWMLIKLRKQFIC